MKKFFGIAIITTLMACNSNEITENKATDTAVVEKTTTEVNNVSFEKETIQSAYTAYINLKDALVSTKFEESKQAAKVLVEKLKVIQGCENTGVIASKIENAKDIAEQRTLFTALSTDLISLFKHSDIKSGIVYIQHCPMANKGDGGDWLASEAKIQNPYYGDEMMECGSVIEEIKTK